MPKFYIRSGDLKSIIDKPTLDEAVICVLQREINDDKCPDLGQIIQVSQTGFDDIKEDDIFCGTEAMLKKANRHQFYFDEE